VRYFAMQNIKVLTILFIEINLTKSLHEILKINVFF